MMYKKVCSALMSIFTLFLSCLSPGYAQIDSTKFLTHEKTGFDKAFAPKPFNFPFDHGPHQKFKNEWWYFTGNLSTRNNRQFGYQLTFFRLALNPTPVNSLSAWRSNQIYMAHFTVTDIQGRRFYSDERVNRASIELAGAKNDQFHIWLRNWSAKSESSTAVFPIALKAQNNDYAIQLKLTTQKPLVLQGNNGLSQKSFESGNASFYYSYTRLPTTGSILIGQNEFKVTGSSWMDREWSSSSLSEDQAGWDWFSIQLSDNTEIMYYQLRKKNGSIDRHSAGTLVFEDGKTLPLSESNTKIKVLDDWKSPNTTATYPSRWTLWIPSQELKLNITPSFDDQELNLSFRYWEGAVSVQGKKKGKMITGVGYVELTGY